MTPHKDSGKGTWVLDLYLGKLGRYKAASGTDDLRLFQDVKAMIRVLRKNRRWDVLALLVNRHIRPLELHDAFIRGDLNDLPSPDDLRSLQSTADRWVAQLDRKPTTRKQYRWHIAQLGEGSLGQLPLLLEKARTQALKTGKKSKFNDLCSAVRGMLAWAVKPSHALYQRVEEIEALRVKRRKGNPQTPDEVTAIATAMGDLGSICWDLSVTGMRRGEYFPEIYEVKPDRILIHGTKTENAERVVFKAYPITGPRCGYGHFRKVLSRVTAERVITHDFRYTFMRWCGQAGIEWPRIKWYAGHSVKDVTESYFRGRGFADELGPDAGRFRGFLGESPTLSHTMRVERGGR